MCGTSERKSHNRRSAPHALIIRGKGSDKMKYVYKTHTIYINFAFFVRMWLAI